MEPELEPSLEPPEESDPSLTLDLGITIVIGVGALEAVEGLVVVVEGEALVDEVEGRAL